MKFLRRYNILLLIMLIVLNGFFLSLAFGVVQQVAHPLPGTQDIEPEFSWEMFIVFLVVLSISFVILIKYGTWDDIEQKIKKLVAEKPRNAYELSKLINKKWSGKYGGMGENYVKRAAGRLEKWGYITKGKDGTYSC